MRRADDSLVPELRQHMRKRLMRIQRRTNPLKNFFERARSRRAGVTLVVGTAGSVVLFLAAGPVSSASTPGPNAKVAVPQGIGAGVLRNATVFGSTPPSTPETVSFILKARDEDQLKASVESGSPQGYLSVRQFAGRYGQTRENIAALESYLGQFGL